MSLAGRVCRDGDWNTVPEIVRKQIANSEKFVVTLEALQVLDQLESMFNGDPSKYLAFAKLPYPAMWIEHDASEHTHLPKEMTRVGWLYAESKDPGVYLAVSFVGFDHQGHAMGNTSFTIDTNINEAFCRPIANADPAKWKASLTKDRTNTLNTLMEHAGLLICLLNCRNLLEIAPAPISKNRQNTMRRAGRRPLFEFKTLQLKITQSQLANGEKQGLTRDQMRLHMVRGHFKKRKSGLYWWSPFMRGNIDLGVVQKNYQVEP